MEIKPGKAQWGVPRALPLTCDQASVGPGIRKSCKEGGKKEEELGVVGPRRKVEDKKSDSTKEEP